MISPVFWLAVLWVILWRDASAASFAGGVVAAIVVVALVPRSRTVTTRHRVSLNGLVRLAGYTAVALIQANLELARDVLRLGTHPETSVVTVRLEQASDVVLAITAHLVTLTPGTLALDADPATGTLVIHALHGTTAPAVVAARVEELASHVVRAFQPVAETQPEATTG